MRPCMVSVEKATRGGVGGAGSATVTKKGREVARLKRKKSGAMFTQLDYRANTPLYKCP